MYSKIAFTFLCVSHFYYCIHGAEFPSFIKLCKRNDPKITDCLKENVELVRPHLKEGIPLMKIPAVDPLHLPRVTLKLNNFNASYINVNIYDATNFELVDFDVDINNNYMKIVMKFPSITLISDYELYGKILLLELSGKGHSSANITNTIGTCLMHGDRVKKNGKTYLKWKNNTLSLSIGQAKVYFDNLFGENEELTATTNQIINENIFDFLHELQPLIEETIASFIFSIIEQVFKTYTLDELFPQD